MVVSCQHRGLTALVKTYQDIFNNSTAPTK